MHNNAENHRTLTPLSSIELFCVVDDDVIKLFVLMVDALDGWWLFGMVNGRWLSPFVALSVYVQCVRWACETHNITSYTDSSWLSSELLLLLLLLLLFIWDASIISALMYATCSIGGVVVVVEHICDETRSAVWPPLLLPFDDVKYVLVTLDAVAEAIDVEDVTEEFTTRTLVNRILALCWLLPTTIVPFAMSSTIELPPISRVLFGTRP